MKFLLLFLFTTIYCDINDTDFDTLMGKHKRVFRFVKLEEDKKNYALFRTLFLERFNNGNRNEAVIPKVIHFIWLGKKPYPKKSILKLLSWMKLHKEYTFKLWTDKPRELGIHNLQEIIVKDDDLKHIKAQYHLSNNPAEKSDLLRYEILYNEGGIYLDHDVACIKNIDPLLSNHEFFATLSPLAKPIIYPNTIRIRNSIIAFKPKHPLFLDLFDLIKTRFSQIQTNGIDYQKTLEIVTKRTFIPFHDTLLKAIVQPKSTGIIYPVGYFTKILNLEPIYANESMDGLWWREEKSFYEEYLEIRINKLENRFKYLVIATLILFCLAILKKKKQYVRPA